MRLPTKDQVRYHGIRWVWVVLLAALAYVAFPSSATNVEPLPVGTPADHDVVAPFTFPVNKSDEELAREAEELAGTVKPIYQFQDRALDSAGAARPSAVVRPVPGAGAPGASRQELERWGRGVPAARESFLPSHAGAQHGRDRAAARRAASQRRSQQVHRARRRPNRDRARGGDERGAREARGTAQRPRPARRGDEPLAGRGRKSVV